MLLAMNRTLDARLAKLNLYAYLPAVFSVMEGLFLIRCFTMQPMATVSLSAPSLKPRLV